MQSQEVVHRARAARHVLNAGTVHLEAIVQALTEKLSPALESGEPVPDFGAPVRLSTRLLAASLTQLLSADLAHLLELGDDTPLRDEREARIDALYDEVVELREAFTPFYGEAAARSLGLVGITPRDPTQLLHFSSYFLGRFPEVTLPPSRIRSLTLDVAAYTARIEEKCKRLHATLLEVTREIHEGNATLATKQRALDAFDAQHRDSANLLSAMLALAGLYELSERVRYRTPKPGSEEVPGDEEVPEEGEPVEGSETGEG